MHYPFCEILIKGALPFFFDSFIKGEICTIYEIVCLKMHYPFMKFSLKVPYAFFYESIGPTL